MKGKAVWLVYRKLRPAFGISFAFILLSGVFLGVMNFKVIMAALGFLFIELFAAFYNDYWDFSDDIKNERKDKFTTLGLMSTRSCLYLSLILACLSLIFLMFTDTSFLMIGIPYLALGFLYSHKRVRLKGTITGYAILSSPFFILPLLIAGANGIPLTRAMPISTFLFFQYMYILCQKDSTDMRDKKNVFMVYGWKRTSMSVTLFSISASISLFIISLSFPPLMLIWLFNTALKSLNIKDIAKGTVTRGRRGRIILLDYTTEYLYILGGLL